MITMINVSRHFGAGSAAKIVLEDANLRINPNDRLGILAASGTGKTTVAHLLAGLDQPNSGQIWRRTRLSWPIGFSAALHPHLTAEENVILVAGLYNVDPIDLVVRVQTFAELGPAFFHPVADLSPGARGQLAIGLSMSVDFDTYLADELSSVGSKAFQTKTEAAINDRLNHAGLVLLTRHIRTIEKYCDRFAVLTGARFVECDDAAQAEEILNFDQTKEPTAHVVV